MLSTTAADPVYWATRSHPRRFLCNAAWKEPPRMSRASAVISPHAASMPASSVPCVCRLRSYTFNLQAEKISSIVLRNVEYGGMHLGVVGKPLSG